MKDKHPKAFLYGNLAKASESSLLFGQSDLEYCMPLEIGRDNMGG